MYRVISREFIGRGRKGRYIIEYSIPWPSKAKRIYLIGVFSGWFPGHIRLRKRGDRGYAYVKLWPGVYAYGFIVDNDLEIRFDPENPDTIYVRPFYEWNIGKHLSKSIVKRSDNPLEEIVHNEQDPSFLHRFGENVIIRLRTLKTIANPVLILDNREIEYVSKYVFDDVIVYEYHIPYSMDTILRYKFRFTYDGEELFYGNEGVGTNVSYIIVDANNIHGPSRVKWYMGTIYYQIFVDSFENGDPLNDPPKKIRVLEPRERGYYGGDLRGIINRIEYIRSLGVETLYLTPIFPSSSYHRYDVYDYKGIDKYLGTMKDLEELVNIIHRHGMKLVLDIPLHHVSPCHPMFIDAIRKGKQSRFWDWFCFLEEPSKDILEEMLKYIMPECRSDDMNKEFLSEGRKPFYESFFTIWSMPKINHDNIETLDYFVEVTKYWISRGIDGFRIDVGLGILYSWLKAYYLTVKNIDEEFLLLGELNDYPVYYSEYFDSMMDYYWRKIVFEKIVDNKITIDQFIESLNKLYAELPHYQSISLYHSLGTHDTLRIKTIVKGDIRKLKLLYILLFTLPGSPAIYYGDEVGMEGGRDPDNRRPMIWDSRRWDKTVLEHVKKMIRMYREWKALRYGYLSLRKICDELILIRRWIDNEEIIVLANTSDRSICYNIDYNYGKYIELLSNREIVLTKNYKECLEPYSVRVYGRRPVST